MVFSSITFLFYFLPAVLFFYFIAPVSLRNLVLLTFSLLFYAWGEPVYILLMLFSITFNYFTGLYIDKHRASAKAVLIVSVIVNIGLLGFFKYADFFIANFNSISGQSVPLLELPLPIGISFYTFQAMSYVIDLYWGNVATQRSIINFGAYISLFPQLIAGPIVRIATIEEQLLRRTENFASFSLGIRQFICGLGKKVLIANNIGLLWSQISALPQEELTTVSAWLGAFAFTFQIYFDFSGYSDMAIGLGNMFGFDFPMNFDHPYISKSITEFWRRWHITLSTWFKEYVYIPLGGNRKGLAKQLRNILIVWFLTGFWHGASWNFILWGLYFGLFLMAEKMFLGKVLERLPSFVRHFYTMFVVIISWVIFAFDSLSDILPYLAAMFGIGAGFINDAAIYFLYTNLLLFGISALGSTGFPSRIAASTQNRMNSSLKTFAEGFWLLAIFLLSLSFLIASSYNPFLYFRF